ncbi:MAG: hypothetical protein KIT02_00070 [Devosia sp.]|uniref:DUF1254 domain-containing protein n=1 Tax=Devosia sp. TaxID=1871048 RepID=UPI0024C54C10|nr:hypothetical protein [Devosia sp.]UYN99683.1 MAG: hypothetical protein KIT02_00070 [Devosia sp.]
MIRTLLWLIGGVLLGGVIHIVVILTLPLLAEETAWTRALALAEPDRMAILDPVAPGEPNPLHLDPDLIYGLCRLDLSEGPGFISGTLPDAFWSVAVFDPSGIVTFSTTNRDGIGQTLEMGLFNAAQTRQLAQQQLDIAEGLLIVEQTGNDLFALIRLAPPHDIMRPRFAERLADVQCGTR